MNMQIENHVLEDLFRRGFRFDDFKPYSGSMLPIKECSEYKDVLVYREGSIANFREIVITYISREEDIEGNKLDVAHIFEHSFSESGEYYVDHETMNYYMRPVKDLANMLCAKGIMTHEEYEQHRKEFKERQLARMAAKKGE